MKVLGARGLRGYLRTMSNTFDFVVVMSSVPTLIEPILNGSLSASATAAGLKSLTVFRMFRVFRIALLLHKVRSMRRMLATVFSSVTAIMHLSVFIGFALVTSAILATTMFARPYPPSPGDVELLNQDGYSVYAGGPQPQFHFDTFADSMISMFIITTGTGWCLCGFPRLAVVY